MNRRLAFLLLPALIAAMILLCSGPTGATTDADCSNTPITQWPASAGGNDHFYQGVCDPGYVTWHAAKLAAETAGGHLATLTSSAENDFVFSLIDSPGLWAIFNGCSLGPWIGAFQPDGSPEPAGGWSWVTGEAFVFSNWAVNEPNNQNGNENVASFWSESACPGTGARSAKWNDGTPDHGGLGGALAYVVEWEQGPSPTPTPGTLEVTAATSGRFLSEDFSLTASSPIHVEVTRNGTAAADAEVRLDGVTIGFTDTHGHLNYLFPIMDAKVETRTAEITALDHGEQASTDLTLWDSTLLSGCSRTLPNGIDFWWTWSILDNPTNYLLPNPPSSALERLNAATSILGLVVDFLKIKTAPYRPEPGDVVRIDNIAYDAPGVRTAEALRVRVDRNGTRIYDETAWTDTSQGFTRTCGEMAQNGFGFALGSPATLTIIDPLGRLASPAGQVRETQQAFISTEDAHPSIALIYAPMPGDYRAIIRGLADGEVHTVVSTFGMSGETEATRETTAHISQEEELVFPVHVSADGSVTLLPTASPTPTTTPTPTPTPTVAGWRHTCYLGPEQPIDQALADIADNVLAVYRLEPDQKFGGWFPGRPDLSTISTVSPYQPLLILMANDAAWPQTPSSTPPTNVNLVQGWNSVCYTGQQKAVADATSGIAGKFGILYMLTQGQWSSFAPDRPDLTTITELQPYDSVLVLVTEEGGATWAFGS